MSVGRVNRKSFTLCGSDNFIQNVLISEIPVDVNFHTEWCEPCLTLTPMLKRNADLVHAFEVKAVPTVL